MLKQAVKVRQHGPILMERWLLWPQGLKWNPCENVMRKHEDDADAYPDWQMTFMEEKEKKFPRLCQSEGFCVTIRWCRVYKARASSLSITHSSLLKMSHSFPLAADIPRVHNHALSDAIGQQDCDTVQSETFALRNFYKPQMIIKLE